jgi:universal stress protein A
MATSLRTILIALDATDEAEEVLEGATALDPRGAVDFHVITVIPPLLGGVSGMDGATFAASWPLRDMEETVAQETTKYIRERAAAFGIAPDRVATRIGRPATEIRAHAEKIGADLIVIGSHGRHGLPGLMLGSTANGVLHDAPCDVLTVRVGADDDSGD